MASRRKILRLLDLIRNPTPVEHFVGVDERLESDNPTELLRQTGVGVGFLTLRPNTCEKILEHVIDLVEHKDYTTGVEGLHQPKNRLDVELPPRGYCWEVLQRILSKWKKDKRSPWHRFKCKGLSPGSWSSPSSDPHRVPKIKCGTKIISADTASSSPLAYPLLTCRTSTVPRSVFLVV